MTNLAVSQRPAIKIRLNTFKNAYTKKPVERDVTWTQFCSAIQPLAARTVPADDRAERKKALPALNTAKLSKPHNENANVEHLTALPIDVDSGDLASTVERAEALGLAALFYESPSSPNKDRTDRFRVIVPLDAPIDPSGVKQARKALAELLGIGPGQGVEQADAASQVFFMGGFEGDPERWVYDTAGRPASTEYLTGAKLKHDWQSKPSSSSTPKAKRDHSKPVDHTPIGELRDRDEPVLAALLELHAAPGGDDDRRLRLRATGAYLAQRGRGEKAIAAIVSRIPTKRGPARAVAEAIDGARDEDRGVPNVAGWNRLHDLNPDAADRLDRACDDHFDRRCRERREAKTNADPNRKAGTPGTEPTAPGAYVDLSTPIQKLRYLCEGLGLAFDGKCAAVHGYAGSSKGLFLSMLALCVASGTPVFGEEWQRSSGDERKRAKANGHAVKRVPVVYGDAETGELAEIRLKRLALSLGIDLGELQRGGWFTFYRLDRPLSYSEEKGPSALYDDLEAACKAVDKGEGTLLALDSYSSLVAGDENKSEYADPMWALGRLGSRVNAVPVVTMHERKGDRDGKGKDPNPLEGISGTNRLAAALATSIRLTPSKDDDRVILVTCTRAPETRFKPVSLSWVDDGQGLLAVTEPKNIISDKERAELRAADKATDAAQALAKRITDAERAMVFRLASIERKPDDTVPAHMNAQPSLSVPKLAEAAGVHQSKPGQGQAPAIIQKLVAEGWLVADDEMSTRHTCYRLAPTLPKEPRRWGNGNKFEGDARHRELVAEAKRGRAVADRA